jgi:hypothetical protein
MGRIFLEFLLPLLLPTVLYLLWVRAERSRIERLGRGEPPRWQDAPFLWLALMGVVLAGAVLMALHFAGGAGTEGVYVPPRLIDGQVVPGHVDPRPPAR